MADKKDKKNKKDKKKKAKRLPDLWMKVRVYIILFTVICVFAGMVVVHLFKISVIDHKKYAQYANNYHFGTISLPAERGSIYDANGTPLAWSANVYKIYIDSKLYKDEVADIEKRNEQLKKQSKKYTDVDKLTTNFVNYLSGKLKIEPNKIRKILEKDSRYTVLKKQVEKPDANEILSKCKDMGFNCVATEDDTKRYYTQNDLAASVIGFTNSEGQGQYGLESYYNSYLSGIEGREISAKDAHGNIMPYRKAQTYDAVDGSSLYLTIDTNIQYYLEESLEKMCEEHNVANRACGIIMNCKTGAVLAMATAPGFDLNNPSEITDKKTIESLSKLSGSEYDKAYADARELQWRNKCVGETLLPGSIFKTFTGSAAIEEAAIDPKTFSYNCIGYINVVDAVINCSHRSGHGHLDFQSAMTKSCNPAFVRIGLDLGKEKFGQYFESFGFTEKTGIDLPGEADSIYYNYKTMSSVDLASSAFGQANQLTPIQIATAYCAAVNGGYLLEPYVVGEIKDSNGNTVVDNTKNVKRQVISSETSEYISKVLENVVEETPDSNAYIAGYKIGGKTGTAQKIGEYKLEDEGRMQYVADYACFAPADDPEIVMLIMADEPDKSKGYYGYQVAAPAAKEVFENILPYLGYYPEQNAAYYSSSNVEVPNVKGMTLEKAEQTLKDSGIEYSIVGDSGESVTGQTPAGGTSMFNKGVVMLYTENSGDNVTVNVPNIVGMTVEKAQKTLYSEGLNMYAKIDSDDSNTTSDEIIVKGQGIAEGTVVNKGSVISVTTGREDSDDSDDSIDSVDGD